jgi:hypothetical protein
MAYLYDLARMTTATSGTGTVTLGAAVAGFLSFAGSGVSDGETITYAIKDGSNSEIGRGVYTASGTTLTRSVLRSTNSNNAINLSGSAEVFISPSQVDLLPGTKGAYGLSLINGTLSASVAANALTISVKTLDGADPSAASPVVVVFRSSTATSGSFVRREITSATSLTISSGSTLGTANSVAFRLWVTLFDDSGTIRLGAINARVGGASPTQIVSLSDNVLASSTAEGGAGAADTAGVIYTGTAVTSKAMRIIGFLTWDSGLATAGTWSSGPTVVQLFGPGIPRPGDVIAHKSMSTTTPFSTTSTNFVDSGVQLSHALSSPANINWIRARGGLSPQANGMFVHVCLCRETTALYPATSSYGGGASQIGGGYLEGLDAPGSTSSVQYRARVKVSGGSTPSFFPYGGVSSEDGSMVIQEIMG